MYKITFYVPKDHLEKVQQAMFAKGAGKIGDYECCSWKTLGIGQFKPLKGSDPHIGSEGKIETVEEYLVEMVCEQQYLQDVLKELIEVHPYETPAYAAWEITHYGK